MTADTKTDIAEPLPSIADVMRDAAEHKTRGDLMDEIETLRRELEEARSALAPFAEGSKNVDQYYGDSTGWQEEMDNTEIIDALVLGDYIKVCTMGDLRNARRALSEGKEGQK